METTIIEKTLELLQPTENELGSEKDWASLYKTVMPWMGGLELSDSIKNTIRRYLSAKIPELKQNISEIDKFDDESLISSLSEVWFGELTYQTEKPKQETLFLITSQVLKSIETFIYQKVFENLTHDEFEQRLGISSKIRNLLIELLKVSRKTDDLLIRFLIVSRLVSESKDLILPALIWPHESLLISNQLNAIAENSQEWLNEPGADAFKKYLETIALQYKETDQLKIEAYLKVMEKCYEELLRSEFPIILVCGTTEGAFYSPSYIDPELKVSISTADARVEEPIWEIARKGMIQTLDLIGARQFEQEIMRRPLRSVIAIGSHSVNLCLNAVAQEEPGITIFFNEQVRGYDRDFPEFIKLINNRDVIFPEVNNIEGKLEVERMSRSNTVYHEFAHGVYHSSLPECKRFGDQLTSLDEIKAEAIYRCLVPLMIESTALSGNKAKWTVAMLGTSCQMLRDQPVGDPYYYASIFSLNKLFEDDVVAFDGEKIKINDFDAFFEIQKQIADNILSLYRDQDANDQTAKSWIKKYCSPTEQVKLLEKFLKG